MTGAIFSIGLAHPFAPARAQTTATQDGWQFSLTPYLWLAGISGTVKTPVARASSVDVDVSFGSILSNLSVIPVMGSAELRHGRFGLLGDLIALRVKTDVKTPGVLFNGGTAQQTTINGTVLGMYRVVETPRQFLDLGAGVRPWGLSTKVTFNPGLLPESSVSSWVSWVDPLLAARYHLELGRGFGLTAYGDIGGFGAGSELTWQLLGTLDYAIAPWSDLHLGWRSMRFEYRASPALRFNIGMNGPYLGGTIRF